MNENKSLVRHVLINNFRIFIIAIAVVLFFVFFLLCNVYKDDKNTEAKAQLAQTEQEVLFRVEENIQRTDYIVKNILVMDRLNEEFASSYELLRFINDFTIFMSAFEEVNDIGVAGDTNENLLLYTANPTLMESQYLRHISRLDMYDTILRYTESTQQLFYWQDTIETDEYGRNYLKLYRCIPMEYDCVIVLKVFLDDIIKTNGDNPYRIAIHSLQDIEQNSSLFFSKPLLEKFILTAEVPRTMLYGQYALYFILLGILGVAFLFVVYVLSSRSVLRAMKDILNLITQIQGGELLAETEADKSQWEEVQIIKDKISVLTGQLNDLSRKEYEGQLVQKNLEIELLNSQINPHLLYNSLSAVKLIAFKERNKQIDEVVDALIDYYRLILNQGKQLITVGKELEYLEKYIHIHEISKKISYEVDFDVRGEVFDIEIPHLLLQPIVENAIIHGLNTAKEACVTIGARAEGDDLLLEVADNGVGIEPARMDELNRLERLGYGLNSVVQRAQFYYGDNFRLAFSSAPGQGTRVSLRVSKTMNH